MKALLLLIGWCILLALCWPLAVAALLLWPILWVLSWPFRVVAMVLHAVFAFLSALLFLPARLLGWRRS